jgi:hypothetical protein
MTEFGTVYLNSGAAPPPPIGIVSGTEVTVVSKPLLFLFSFLYRDNNVILEIF